MKRSFYEKLLMAIITISWRLIRAYCKHHNRKKESESGDHTSEG